MFKKPTRKQLIIRRIILSIIATFSVIIIVTAAILFMLGYRLDGGDGRLEQGALLQFDSTPSGANILIDGKQIGSQTSTKKTLLAGTHTITMEKSGYEDWSRTLNLTAGTLTWLNYTRFVPIKRTPSTVEHYASLVAAQFSPDLKNILVQEKPDVPTFHLVDISSQDVKSTDITLPQDLYSEATTAGLTHTFSIVRWNSAGRYVLMKHMYKDQTEWLMVDTQDATKDVNITRLLSAGFTDIQFAGSNGTTLYGLTNDGVVRKLDLSAGTLSRSFITQVKSFAIFDNNIISYVGTSDSNANAQVMGVYRDGDDVPHIIKTVGDTTTPLHIATGRYFNDDYVAYSVGQDVTILKGSYPSSTHPQDASSFKQFATMKLTNPVTNLTISPQGDYVVAQSNAVFMSYEIEHQRSAMGAVAVDPGKTASNLKWLDMAHLWNDDTDSLIMRDFDGTNAQAIMSVVSGYDAALSQDGHYFYGIGKASDGNYVLQRVLMVLG